MTAPVRPAEPAEPTTLTFSRVLTVDEARQVRDLLIRFSDVQDEREAALAEAASLREQLGCVSNEVLRLTNVVAHMNMERAGLYGEESYKMLREQHELACEKLTAALAEAASLRERLSAVEDDLSRVTNEAADWHSRFKGAQEAHRDAEARVSELRGLVKRWAAVDEETGLCLCYEPAVECDADGACPGRESRAWLAAHPLKTEGDGGTPTGGTRP